MVMMMCGDCMKELSSDEAYFERTLESDVFGRLNALLEVFVYVYDMHIVCTCACTVSDGMFLHVILHICKFLFLYTGRRAEG